MSRSGPRPLTGDWGLRPSSSEGRPERAQCFTDLMAVRALNLLEKVRWPTSKSIDELVSETELKWMECGLTDVDMEAMEWIIEKRLGGAAKMRVKMLGLDDNPKIRNREGSMEWVGRLGTLEVLGLSRCSSLQSVTIPEGVKKIGERAFGERAFRGCRSL